MRSILLILIAAMPTFAFGQITLEEAKTNGMQETLQNYISHNPVIADICVFEQEWIPPAKPLMKGELIQRAVITHVHCGPVKIGDHIEYTHIIEEAPRFLENFTSTVPGKLRTFFFNPTDSTKTVAGVLKIEGDAHWGFSRVEHVFAELFALELTSNPKLK